MQYFGGKHRISKELSAFLESELADGQPFIDMFCGSCNVISKISPNRIRIANDKHKYLIAMWRALQSGWVPPTRITKEDYIDIKDNKDANPALTGFVGFGMSFGGKWFGGFTGEISKNGQNYLECAKNGVNRKIAKMSDVEFVNLNYDDVYLPSNSLIYCDIPYKGTTQYCKKEVGEFNHTDFYEWGRRMADNGHKVLVSEYADNIPPCAEVVWQTSSGTTNAAWQGSSKKTIEVVYKLLPNGNE